MSYPVTPRLSVLSVQMNDTEVAVTAVTCSPVGADGGSLSTTPGVPKTWNSARPYRSAYRHGSVAYTRTNRPSPVTGWSSTPPRPVVVLKSVFQKMPSADVSIRYARAQPRDQRRLTRVTVETAPRSTEIHWSRPGPLRQPVA